jgi:hypothetical protein
MLISPLIKLSNKFNLDKVIEEENTNKNSNDNKEKKALWVYIR